MRRADKETRRAKIEGAGGGGLTKRMRQVIRRIEKGENVEAVSPTRGQGRLDGVDGVHAVDGVDGNP